MEHTGYLGIGSNVGDRLEMLRAAVREMRGHGVFVEAASSVYETEPVGEVLAQGAFLNACLRIRTECEPLQLLDLCKGVERALGRPTGGVRHGPRPIDIDLLLLGEIELVHPRLTLPHPQVTSRRFVLVPLLELHPELVLPSGARVHALLAGLGDGQGVTLAHPAAELD